MTEPITTTAATTDDKSMFTEVAKTYAVLFRQSIKEIIYHVKRRPNLSKADVDDLISTLRNVGEAMEEMERKFGEILDRGDSNAS